jgi:predicted Rossmann fold nucleotide-binding protein DprA/Smf involved in DNA uptake
MKIGITGSREGASYEAHNRLKDVLRALEPTELHHGDCVGVDSEAHTLVLNFFNKEQTLIIKHPPKADELRAYRVAGECRAEAAYLERNHNIVDAVDMIVAVPKTAEEVKRSGTWATVRYAIKQGKPVMLIKPDGSIEWK